MVTFVIGAIRSGSSRAALAMGLFWCAPHAHAQTNGSPEASPTQDADIVITGIRRSLADALSVKRDSAQVVDAISAEDIGKFPDKNIGEALQRVTGVQITRSGGEGSGVSIRGASPALNRVEINGQTALGTGAGGASRAVEFRDLPAEFVSRLEVVKSATADMTEGGLGGTVRIITRRPFDSRDGYLAGSAQAVYGDLADRVDPKFAVIGSRLFANDTIGVLVSATYENRSLWYDRAHTTGWRQIDRDPATPGFQPLDLNNDGNGDFYPDIPRYFINTEVTERYAVNGILEWRPSDSFRTYLEGTYTRGKQTIDAQSLTLGTGQNAAVNGGVDTTYTQIGPDDTVSRVRFNNASAFPDGLTVGYRNILGEIDRQTLNGKAGFDWEASDTFKVDGSFGYARAKSLNNEINASATAQNVDSNTIDYDNATSGPNLITSVNVMRPDGITQAQVLHRPRFNRQFETDAKLNFEYTPGGFLTSLKAGAQRRELKVTSRYFEAIKTFNGATGITTLNNYANGTSAIATINTQSPAALIDYIQRTIGNTATFGDHNFFMTGDLGYSPPQRWLSLGNETLEAFGKPDPFINPVPADTWDVTEENLAGYVSGAFEVDFGARLSGIVGLRVIKTTTVSEGTTVRNATGTAPASLTPFELSGSYVEVLPSVNLKLELIPNRLQLRATATDVLSRPSPADLAPRFTLDGANFAGSRGNPGLEPFRASQYDIGAEYYFSRTNYVSITGFRKVITSFIERTTVPEVIDGVTYTISIPTNGDDRVTIDGVEVGGQFNFDFLPGILSNFGAIANYTYQTDRGYTSKDLFTGAPLSFPGLSKHSYNVSAYYEDEIMSLRASYNWRDKHLNTAVGRGNNPEFGEAFGQWDASVNLTLTPSLSLFFEGINLTNEQRYENAASIYRRTVIETYGRRFYAGVRVRL